MRTVRQDLEFLSNQQVTLQAMATCIDKYCQGNDKNFYEFLRTILHRQFAANVAKIYAHCESPIEILLMNALQFMCLAAGQTPIVVGPVDDFETAQKEREGLLTGLWKCQSFYNQLPDDARPDSFRDFLSAWISSSDLTPEGVETIVTETTVYRDLNFIHCLHIALQPTLKGYGANGKAIRPDAILYVPSNSKTKIVVECDGHEYHASKEVFVSDRQRDRKLSESGYKVLRYSGSEIYSAPHKASADLLKSAEVLYGNKRRWEQRLLKSARPPSAETIKFWRARKSAA